VLVEAVPANVVLAINTHLRGQLGWQVQVLQKVATLESAVEQQGGKPDNLLVGVGAREETDYRRKENVASEPIGTASRRQSCIGG